MSHLRTCTRTLRWVPRSSPARANAARFYSSSTSSSPSSTERVELSFDHHEPPAGKEKHSATDRPIVFMHGLFGSRKNNRTVSRVLARELGRHVYAVDLRNHGESPHHPRHDYAAMADDVAGFVEARGLAKPALVGHSMGAKAAMAVALGRPGLVADVVSVDNAPWDAVLGSPFRKYIDGMKRIEDANVSKQSEADKILAEYESELPIRQFLLGNLWTPPGTGVKKFRVPIDILAKELNKMGDFPFKNPDEARFEGPTLFIRGTKSTYVPDEAIPLIGRFFPRFSMVDIDAGHWVISEKPEPFLKAVIDFLEPKE